ncbi:sterol desaturase family protein [Mixta tenebrionis]|uniref:Beta-carotene hydroxylase n=1 Tax=Mixta tenebrionis TaxID=2562439 RepID=A0A506VFF8_9GAMM|nr:sterol desaturase family protein [Mixta tenebrionis]TPW43733.1 beta-carotene hydroxylase [Mixta tenebrionis]
MLVLWNTLIVLATVAIMEVVATLAHKHIMHGWGWGWHLSHHEPRTGWFEVNDLYALLFAMMAIALIAIGTAGVWPLQWIGAGMTLYGALYFMVHDGLVHQRWPFRYIPRRGYLRRLYMAHRLHHAVRGKADCVSFGFLYAPPLEKLQATLRAYNQRRARNTKTETPHDLASDADAARDRARAAASRRGEN